MFVLASFNGPSETRVWVAFLGSAFLAALLGYFPRSPRCGFILGGLASAGLTCLVLGSAHGDMVSLMTAILTPIFAIIASLVGCFFGWIGLARGPKSPRLRVGDRNPFEPGDGSGGEQRQDHQPDDSQGVPEPGAERDAR